MDEETKNILDDFVRLCKKKEEIVYGDCIYNWLSRPTGRYRIFIDAWSRRHQIFVKAESEQDFKEWIAYLGKKGVDVIDVREIYNIGY